MLHAVCAVELSLKGASGVVYQQDFLSRITAKVT